MANSGMSSSASVVDGVPTILERETATYRMAWSMPGYRRKNHGLNLWRERREVFPAAPRSAIDLGCGLGWLVAAWRDEGIEGFGVDLVPDVSLDEGVRLHYGYYVEAAALWDYHPGRVFALGVCADVMEHIPTHRVGDVFRRIGACCREVVFKIANFESVVNGVQLHLTRRDDDFWHGAIASAMGGTLERLPLPTGREEYLFRWRASGS